MYFELNSGNLLNSRNLLNSSTQFRNFLYQEKKWEKQGVYWQAERNTAMRKKTVDQQESGEWLNPKKTDLPSISKEESFEL